MRLWSTPFGLLRKRGRELVSLVSLGYVTYEAFEASDE